MFKYLFLVKVDKYFWKLTILTYTLIFSRYIAIVYPMKYCWWCESHTIYIIGIIWTLALIIASPMLIYARTQPFQFGCEHWLLFCLIYELANNLGHFWWIAQTLYDCKEEWEGTPISMVFTVVLFVVTFIIPFIALTFLYGTIGVKTFRHIQPGEAHTNRDRAQQRIKIKVCPFVSIQSSNCYSVQRICDFFGKCFDRILFIVFSELIWIFDLIYILFVL